MEKTTIIILRHGESTFNREGLIQGNTDESKLTKKGREQMFHVGLWLKDTHIDSFYTSNLLRARESAEIVAKQCGFNISNLQIDRRLEEIDFGSWKARLRSEVINTDPNRYLLWRNKPYELELDGEYPVKDLYNRVNSFLVDEINDNKNGKVKVIVGHGGTISAIINILLRLPKSHHHFLQIDNGSVTVLQMRNTNNDYELSFSNEVPSINKYQVENFKISDRTKSKGELFLVRHGQTNSNIRREYQGSEDPALSNLGEINMRNIAESFFPSNPFRIVCSPQVRAKESANILAEYFGVKTITTRDDLHEFLYGVWEGMSENEVIRYRQSEYNQWQTSPKDANIPYAEHINDANIRCREIWDSYKNDILSWGGSIVSVAHDIVNRLIICNALDLSPNYIWAFKQTNASVSLLAIKDNYDRRLRMLNHNRKSLNDRLSDEHL